MRRAAAPYQRWRTPHAPWRHPPGLPSWSKNLVAGSRTLIGRREDPALENPSFCLARRDRRPRSSSCDAAQQRSSLVQSEERECVCALFYVQGCAFLHRSSSALAVTQIGALRACRCTPRTNRRSMARTQSWISCTVSPPAATPPARRSCWAPGCITHSPCRARLHSVPCVARCSCTYAPAGVRRPAGVFTVGCSARLQVIVDSASQSLYGLLPLGSRVCGHPGITHGGVSALAARTCPPPEPSSFLRSP